MPSVTPDWPATTPCPIAFVGEAPGSEEEREGRPLIGPSGRVFNVGLRSANIDRAQCLVTNVFDEKAEDNDVGPWLRDPVRLEEARLRLAEELDAAQPACVVPLGSTALYALSGHSKIAQFRGAVMEATETRPGTKLLPTYHPAAVMRQWKLLALMVQDFVKAAREAEKGPEIVMPKRELWVAPTLDEVSRFLARCQIEADPLSVDIETGWGMITCVGFAPNAYEAMTVPFVDLRKPNRSYWETAEEEHTAWKWVKSVMEDDTIPKLGQNFPYDIYWFVDYGIEVRNYLHDTRLLHHALYPELPKDLGSMTASYTDLPSWKHWGWRGGQEEKRDA